MPRQAAVERQTEPQPRRGRRWLRAFVILLALAAVLIFCAPMIIAKTPLRQQLVPWALPDLECRVHIGSASLGWFSPIVLREVAVSDPAGRPLLTVKETRSEKTLWGLANDSSQLGKFHIVQPQANIVLRSDGSNLQDALAPLLEPTEEPSADLALAVQVSSGSIVVVDEVSGRQLKLVDLNVTLEKPLAGTDPWKTSLAVTVDSDGERGDLKTDVTWTPPTQSGSDDLGSGEARLEVNQLMLAAAQPLLDRMMPGVQLSGLTSTDLTCSFSGSPASPSVRVGGQVSVAKAAATAPAWLGPDRLHADQIELAGRCRLEGGRLLLEPTTIQSDVAQLELSGSAPVSKLAEQSWLPWLVETLQSEQYRLDGQIDLARLANMLPQTLRLREGLEITSGQVRVQAGGAVTEGQRLWTASITGEGLAGVVDGRPISWQQPIKISLQAHQEDGEPVVDELRCAASFLQVTGSGTLRDAGVSVNGDLDQLARELNRFVDLGQTRLSGKFGGGLTCRQSDDSRLEIRGELAVDGFEFSLAGERPLSEPRLELEFSAQGAADGRAVQRLDQAVAVLRVGSDWAKIELIQPVPQPSWKSSWPFSARASGQLATWLSRLEPWVPLAGYTVAGGVELQAVGAASAQQVGIEQAGVELTQLQVRGGGLFVDEPLVHASLAGNWDLQTQKLTAPDVTVALKTLNPAREEPVTSFSTRGRNLDLRIDDNGSPALTGKLVVRGNVARIMRWFADPNSRPTNRFVGKIDGNLSLSHKKGLTSGRWSLVVDELTYSSLQTKRPPATRPVLHAGAAPATPRTRWETVWSENQVTIEGSGAYDHTTDGLRLEQLGLTTDELQLTAQGQVAQLTGDRLADIKGEIEYDLKQVTAKMQPVVGSDVRFNGRQKRNFFVRGPLVFYAPAARTGEARSIPASYAGGASRVTEPQVSSVFQWPQALTAQAGFGWSAADVYGLQAGEGNVEARLADEVLAVTPLDLTINGGRVTAAPRIELGKTPLTLLLGRGRAIENMEITDQMCRTWLKYAAPLLAQATRIDGRFTVDLEGARVPLATPETGDVAGTLYLHGARLRPGPLLDRFVFLAQQVQSVVDGRPLPSDYAVPRSGLVELEQQAVPFQLAAGRVYHRDLTLNVRGIRIRTSGSVGLDQTLDMMAEVPIQNDWIRPNGLLASLRGQTLKIPVRGTFGRPKLDERVLQQLGRRALDNAAGELIERGLDRALDGLFRPTE